MLKFILIQIKKALMKKKILGIGGMLFVLLMGCNQSNFNAKDLASYPVYEGADLGVVYTNSLTTFKLWAPTAKKVIVKI
mgnify:CR=1 FL=1